MPGLVAALRMMGRICFSGLPGCPGIAQAFTQLVHTRGLLFAQTHSHSKGAEGAKAAPSSPSSSHRASSVPRVDPARLVLHLPAVVRSEGQSDQTLRPLPLRGLSRAPAAASGTRPGTPGVAPGSPPLAGGGSSAAPPQCRPPGLPSGLSMPGLGGAQGGQNEGIFHEGTSSLHRMRWSSQEPASISLAR